MACKEQQKPDYVLRVENAGRFLRIFGTGNNSTATMLAFLTEASEVLRQHGRDSVLLVVSFEGPSLSLGSIYSIVSSRFALARGLRRVACLDTIPEHVVDRGELAEVVASSLGVNFRMFRDIESAEAWLTDNH